LVVNLRRVTLVLMVFFIIAAIVAPINALLFYFPSLTHNIRESQTEIINAKAASAKAVATSKIDINQLALNLAQSDPQYRKYSPDKQTKLVTGNVTVAQRLIAQWVAGNVTDCKEKLKNTLEALKPYEGNPSWWQPTAQTDWARIKDLIQSVIDQVNGMNNPDMINKFLQEEEPFKTSGVSEIFLRTGICGAVMTFGSLSSVIWDSGFIVLFAIVAVLLAADFLS